MPYRSCIFSMPAAMASTRKFLLSRKYLQYNSGARHFPACYIRIEGAPVVDGILRLAGEARFLSVFPAQLRMLSSGFPVLSVAMKREFLGMFLLPLLMPKAH